MSSRTRWLAIGMGVLLVLMGVAETVRVLRGDGGGLGFWFGTLVGGGSLILLGVALDDSRPGPARALVVVGAVAGMLPTMWTLVVPALLVTLVILRLVPSPTPAADPDQH